MKNAIFGGGEVACFLFSLFSVSFFFFFCVFFAIEILKACSIFLKSCLSTTAFKEKSKKMSFYIAEECLAWILFKIRCKSKICKCTQGLQVGLDLKLSF